MARHDRIQRVWKWIQEGLAPPRVYPVIVPDFDHNIRETIQVQLPPSVESVEAGTMIASPEGRVIGFAVDPVDDSNNEGVVTVAIGGRLRDAALLVREGALTIDEACLMLDVPENIVEDAMETLNEAHTRAHARANTLLISRLDERQPEDDLLVPRADLQRFYASTYHSSMAMPMGSILGSTVDFFGGRAIAQNPRGLGDVGLQEHRRYQYSGSKFPEEVQDKAWNLLRDHMTPVQYGVFMENRSVELENNSGSHRLLVNRGGHFTVLDGVAGEGFVVLAGRITERTYPLGDEIAAFIDWFRFRTGELIKRWNCGNFAIVKTGETRW